MTSRKPRCHVAPGGLVDDARHCGRELGHDGPHRLPSGLEWGEPGSYIRHEKDELTLLLVQQQRDQAVARAEKAEKRAALWKETAREHIGRARTALSYADAAQSKHAETLARAEKAEKERDEALAGVRVLARENIEWYERAAASCGHPNHGKQDHDCTPLLPAAESRPLTPDAISDQLVDYVHEDYFWSTEDRVRLEKPALKHALLDAVKRLTEPPQRPDGAEEIERLLMDADRDGGEVYRTDGYTGLADYLAKGLSKGGVRVVTEEQP